MTPGLLGITCGLIEVPQLQHLHPNRDPLIEGTDLDLTMGMNCSLQCQRHFLLRDTDIVNHGSACELVRRSGIDLASQ